jgi:hypothetical protein
MEFSGKMFSQRLQKMFGIIFRDYIWENVTGNFRAKDSEILNKMAGKSATHVP